MIKKPMTIWITGLPCSGKTTIAKELEKKMKKSGIPVIHLDGDDLRNKLNQDLGFSEKDRLENIRRVSHIANLFNEKGYYVVASFVSPLNEHRDKIKEIISKVKIIYLNTPLEECIKRDTKGMYKLAKQNKIKDFTGISSPFDIPLNPDLIINTKSVSLSKNINEIYNALF